ncbi:MAG: phosphoribosylglycinamide formyltransferase [Thermoplasmata archaeon]
MAARLRVGVLASGEGTTAEGLAVALAIPPEEARIALVVVDRPGAAVLDRVRARGLETVVLPAHGRDRNEWARAVTAELARHGVDLVVLAGFLSILPSEWVEHWRGRAVNLHPSLLPRYGGKGMYGRRVHEAVLAAGERETGATVHLVTGAVDGGPVVAQARLPILAGDTPETLRERLRPVEVELLATTVRRFARGALPLPYPGGDDPARDARAAPARRA